MSRNTSLTIHLGLRALARNVTGLAAAIASLPGGVQWATVGSRAVTRDVTKFSAGVALDGLGLAVTGKVVGATALVASGGASASGATSKSTTESTESSAWRARGTATHAWTAHTRSRGIGARALCMLDACERREIGQGSTYCKMADHAARVAATVGCASAQTKSRAISLDVAETLAVVALLG